MMPRAASHTVPRRTQDKTGDGGIDQERSAAIRRQVLFASASNYAGKLVAIAIAFALMPFILHRLGDVQYGLWILIGSTISYGALLDLGIGDAVTKYVAEYHARREFERASRVIATALVLYAGLGLVALIFACLLAPLVPVIFAIPSSEHDTAVILTLLLGVQLAVSIPCAAFAAVLRGLQRYGLLNALAIVGQLVSAAVTVAVLSSGSGVVDLVAVGLFVSLVAQAVTVWCIRRVAPELRLGWRGARRDLVRSVLAFSLSMFAIHAAGRVQSKSDEIVIGAFVSATVVAPYAMARRLSGLPQLAAEQFLKIFMSLAAQLHAENDVYRLRSMYLVGSRITLAILVPIAGVLVTLAAPILTLWIGPQYAGYAPVLILLTVASLIETSQWPGMSILQGMARHHRLAGAWVCAAAANLALSLVLVGHYGPVGVAAGTLIPTAAVCLGFVLPHAARTIGVDMHELLREVFLPALLPAVPMIAVLYASPWFAEGHSVLSILCTASVAGLVYAAGYVCLARDLERQLLHSFARRALRLALMRPIHPRGAAE